MEHSEKCPNPGAPAEPPEQSANTPDWARGKAAVSPAPRLVEGPEAPEDLDLGEVFDAVPPGTLFDAVERTAALGIDRVVSFEKLIAYAQAGKAAAINDSHERALAVAETGKTSKDGWDGPYAAQRVSTGSTTEG